MWSRSPHEICPSEPPAGCKFNDWKPLGTPRMEGTIRVYGMFFLSLQLEGDYVEKRLVGTVDLHL